MKNTISSFRQLLLLLLLCFIIYSSIQFLATLEIKLVLHTEYTSERIILRNLEMKQLVFLK